MSSEDDWVSSVFLSGLTEQSVSCHFWWLRGTALYSTTALHLYTVQQP